MNKINKIVQWAVFGVLLSLTPLIAESLRLVTESKPVTLVAISSKGELVLIGVAIAAAAIGELIASGTKRLGFKLISTGFCVTVVMVGSAYFSSLNKIMIDPAYNKVAVAQISGWIFVSAVVSALACVGLSEVK